MNEHTYIHSRTSYCAITLFLFLFAALSLQAANKVSITNLRTEQMVNPMGLDTETPRMSWFIESDQNHVIQQGYQIIAATSPTLLTEEKADLWNTGKVISRESVRVKYAGRSLSSNLRVYWRVRVFTNVGESEWSKVAMCSIGLTGETRWSGRWVGLDKLMSGDSASVLHSRLSARYLRKDFSVEKKIKQATAYIAGLGLYELYINGEKTGNQVLAPSPTDYRKTIIYNTFDITSQIHQQGNAVGVILGNGRFFAPRQNKPYKNTTFGFPKCRMNIIIDFTDGTHQVISSDESWKLTSNGPIRSNNEYDGETYDARKEIPGWCNVGYDDSKWLNAERVSVPTGTLKGAMTPNMHIVKTVNPQTITGQIVDFGQNLSGWVRLRIHGNAGDTIRIRFAEKLTKDGHLYTDNLRDAQSTDIYVCNGKENGRQWAPRFVYHGFRYVEVTGMGHIQSADLSAEVISDEMQTIGHFSCSDTILNQVYNNAYWGIMSNYKGMPTDCPQRNERQPWLGDRTMGSLGESYLFDNETLYTKWMRDICEAQREDGCIPDVAPAFWNYYTDNVTWPAALPFTCDMLYTQFGNSEVVVNSYPYIRKWLLHITDEYMKDGIVTRDKYGDWCVPPEKLELIHSKDSTRQTNGSLISTAYTIRVLQLMKKFASMQGLNDDAAKWDAMKTDMTDAFNRKFFTIKRHTSPVPGHPLYPDSIFYGNNTVTANLLPLAFGIVPDSCKADVVKNIVANIITLNSGHISCGVIGVQWLLRQLSDHGFADVAYLLATNKTYPSWGYMAEQGATTIWELWNGDKANPEMNSGNHVMLLGDLLTWCYQYLGGIRNADGCHAYEHIMLKPSFEIEDANDIDASYISPYGRISSKWHKTLTHLDWNIEIPANTTADVYLPDGKVVTTGSGKYHYSVDIPTRHKEIVEDQFLYDKTSFPECHASTIAQMDNGDLVSSFFGGTKERNPDVCIWVCRKPKGSTEWTKPQLVADGVFRLGTKDAERAGITKETTDASAGPVLAEFHHGKASKTVSLPTDSCSELKRKACWNPVLYLMPDGKLTLFFKIGKDVPDWTGWFVTSDDGGKTWSERQALPKGFLGPIKNKPELVGDRLICPSSTEKDGWKIHFEIYNIQTKLWKYVGPIDANDEYPTSEMLKKNGKRSPILCIQPSIIKLKNGRLQVLCRTRNGRLATSYSDDHGDTWSKVVLTDLPNNNSGTDAVTLKDGRHILVYNDFAALPGTPKGVRTPVSLAISSDGIHWQHLMTLEDSPISQYSYPAVIQGKDGYLHVVYTWRRQRIAYKKIKLPAM